MKYPHHNIVKHPDVQKIIEIAISCNLSVFLDWSMGGGAKANLKRGEIVISMRDIRGRFTSVARFLSMICHELAHFECKIKRKFVRYHNKKLTYKAARTIGLKAERYTDKVGAGLLKAIYDGKYRYQGGYDYKRASEDFRVWMDGGFAGSVQKVMYQIEKETKKLCCSVKRCKSPVEVTVMNEQLGSVYLCDEHWDNWCDNKQKIIDKLDLKKVTKNP